MRVIVRRAGKCERRVAGGGWERAAADAHGPFRLHTQEGGSLRRGTIVKRAAAANLETHASVIAHVAGDGALALEPSLGTPGAGRARRFISTRHLIVS